MKKPLSILILCLLAAGCSRNGEYRYVSELSLLEPPDALLKKIETRLVNSEFRKTYDRDLIHKIGSSFTGFRQIREYQAILEDGLIYVLIKTGNTRFSDGLRGEIKKPISRLILSEKPGEELIQGLNTIVALIQEKKGDDLIQALQAYNARITRGP